MAYSSEAPTLAAQIIAFRGDNLRNFEIAKRVGCSDAYVSRTLSAAGIPAIKAAFVRGRFVPKSRCKRNVYSARQAAKRLRNAMAEYYEATIDTDALDILEALCAVDEGISKLWEEWA